jgi:Domain of unknown function (DUF5060)/Putative collagen-binding domain of a collagenase
VFEEVGGVVAVEAEHFVKQTATAKRAWHLTTTKTAPKVEPDGDPSHAAGAAGGAYLEALPDTRRSDKDKLVAGNNFSNEPGKLAVLHYRVHFNTPGRYYVWVRAYSTGAEDNGLHVGIDGTWPESGRRMQWSDGKNSWRWDCKQRTDEKHTGVPMQIWLDVAKAGEHEIMFSMREDGFEFDRFLLTTNKEYKLPDGIGPGTRVKAGKLPAAFAEQTPVPANAQPRREDGDGAVAVTGELKQWHKVTLTLDGPFARETDADPNPFTDCRLTVTFRHESGTPEYQVPGYFAADGDAANSSATAGTKWRAHLSLDKPGKWTYTVSFAKGKLAALDPKAGTAVAKYDGKSGTFDVAKSDKTGRDFRAQGRLEYVGKHYLRFAGTGTYFLKAGPDSPETLLAYSDFDGTEARKKNVPLKTWQPHAADWKPGDPTWKGGKGKGLLGALNYLSDKGCNAFSFLSYNAGGDGDNVWPFVTRDDKLHYDCSKLDQWGVVFDHAQAKGLYLHFKMQETENDDDRVGDKSDKGSVTVALDGGDLGSERKLYCRELIARYGHCLALNWNLGEENTQSTAQQKAMAGYIRDTDPYKHHIVVHTFPNRQDPIYTPLLGKDSPFTGASLQNGWNAAHPRTLKWVTESAKAGKPWVVANDEQNPASLGVPPDKGYKGHDGVALDKKAKGKGYTADDVRKFALWGTLTAGGAGVEYYFGYQLLENDLNCEDFRSRDKSWDYGRHALDFFRDHKVPFWEMTNADALVGNRANDNSRYCLAKPGEVYVVYLPTGGTTDLDLGDGETTYTVAWYNPRTGGALQNGSVREVKGSGKASLGNPPTDPTEDWVVHVRTARP